MKTYKTLLLAVMVAGVTAFATEAYAQSNTERLMTIDENTDGILDIVRALSESLLSMQESIDELTDAVAALSVPDKSDAQVESAITDFDSTLNNILSGVQLNAAVLNDLSSILASINTDVASIKASLVDGSNGGLAQSIDVLASTVNRNEVTTSDRLTAIEESIKSLEAQISAKPDSVSAAGTSRDSISYEVTTYTYKSQASKRSLSGADLYNLDLKFSCNGPVLIDTVRTDLSLSTSWIVTRALPDRTTVENNLEVNNRDLYNTRFETSPGFYQVYNRPVDFELYQLPAGVDLRFESQQFEDGSKINDSTRTAYHRGYTITVNYLGASDVRCSFGGTDSGADLSVSGSLLMAPTMSGTSVIRDFSGIITCDDDPAEIIGMTATVIDWTSSLAEFSEFEVKHIDSNKVVDIGFNADGELNSYAYPISFSGEDLRISGQVPGSDASVLVQILYRTISGGECGIA